MVRNKTDAADKSRFLVTNLIRGMVYLAILLTVFLVIWNYFDLSYEKVLEPVYDRPLLVYIVFTVSEVVFGIIPPEFFMLWASAEPYNLPYEAHIVIFAVISYLAGIAGFFFGGYFNRTRLYRILEERLLRKHAETLRKYGYFLLIVAALTPLPFSAVCMLMGAVKYSTGRFLLFSALRFLKFAAYATVIFHTASLWFLV
jgi:membrane protein YqaA with SNARE-associated domain